MTTTEFSIVVSNYESSLILSKRKEKGVFYTDLSLASKIIDELSIPKDAFVLDPCCGSGSFNFALMQKNIVNAYGTDIDEVAIQLCKKNIPNAHFLKINSIEVESQVTLSKLSLPNGADYIIGNPPYAKWEPSKNTLPSFNRRVVSSGNNLFIAGLIRAFELVKSGGIISYIIPKNFLHVSTYNILRKDILKNKTIISIVDIGAYFKNVRGEQIILTVQNSLPGTNHRFDVKQLINDEFVTQINILQSFFDNEILLFKNETDYNIYNKLNSYSKLNSICQGYIGRGRSNNPDAIVGKEIRKFGYKNTPNQSEGNQIFIQNIYSSESGVIAAFGGQLAAAQTVTILTDGDAKICRFLLGMLHSDVCNFFLYRYCYNYSKLTMHTDAKYLQKIPLPKINEKLIQNIVSKVIDLEKEKYMTEKWFSNLRDLNTMIYKAYKLTKVEQDYIDAEMKLIQSKKWQ